MSKKPSNEDVFSEPEIRAKLDIEDLVWRQIDRTNISASYDEVVFAANVQTLMSMLPRHKRDELQARHKEYVSTREEWKYRIWAGIQQGTIEEPSDGSPWKVEVTEVDWHFLYELVLNAFEETRVSWKTERVTKSLGRVKKEDVKATPYFKEVEE